MLPKKIDWPVLAQCDLYAVKVYVEKGFRIAEELVRPLSKRIFDQRVSDNLDWKKTYEVMCKAYESLSPNFVIENDNYGGYCLVYHGKQMMKTKTVLRGKPLGFVRPVRDGITEWSVMRSSRTGDQLLLVGPMRFVNSDCNPNCEYDFSSSDGVVQLKVKKTLYPGSEVLVKYGDEFFEKNTCRCQTCERIISEAEKYFSTVLNSLIFVTVEEIFYEIKDAHSTVFNAPKRRGMRPRLRAEMFKALFDDPVEETGPDQSFEAGHNLFEEEHNLFEENVNSESVSNETFISDCNISPTETEDSSANDESSSNVANILAPRASSPVAFALPLGCPVSTISKSSFCLDGSSFEIDCHDPKIYTGSLIRSSDARSLIELLCSKLHLTDEGSVLLHSSIKALLPQDNCLPSGHAFVRKVKENFESAVRTKTKVESYAFCVLNFRNQISQIVGRNLSHILNYSTFRKENKENDLNESIAPIAEIDENKSISLSLILSADGVSIKKSTFKKELWPVWLQIADLPPKLRMSRNNIILAALYVGAETPNWDDIVPHLRAELVSDIEILDSDNLEITVKLKTVLLVSDLVAKPHILNMFQFNGYYGCHYCFAEGTTIGRTHSYYPHNQQAEIREPETNDKYVEIAEYGRSGLFRNVAGIKGRSAFSSIINGLPLAAPIDYMHCVLLGVFPDFLKLIAKSMSFGVKQKIDERVQNLACPREMIAYSRKIRCLDELPLFKANEVFNWLFYVGPIVFLKPLRILYTNRCPFSCIVCDF